MALIKCPECSREISDKADACPHCGLPIAKFYQEKPETGPTINCLDCGEKISLEAEVCPKCGLFNSQKYKDLPQPLERPVEPLANGSKRQRERKDNSLIAAISLMIALFMGYVTGSVLVGLFTFLLCMAVHVRVEYLYDHPEKRLKNERHLYTWKGAVAYLIVVMLMVAGEKAFAKWTEKEKVASEASQKALEEKVQKAKNKMHLEKAKELLAKAQNLTDDEWMGAKGHLTSIHAGAAEFTESRELLPKVTAHTDEIEKKRAEAAKRKAAEDKRKAFEAETASLNAKGKRLKAKHPEWSIDECDTISKGKIHIGMTEDQVAAAWGRPYHINRSVGSYGTHEQWVMHEMGNTYVYFENGICTSMQGVR